MLKFSSWNFNTAVNCMNFKLNYEALHQCFPIHICNWLSLFGNRKFSIFESQINHLQNMDYHEASLFFSSPWLSLALNFLLVAQLHLPWAYSVTFNFKELWKCCRYSYQPCTVLTTAEKHVLFEGKQQFITRFQTSLAVMKNHC